MMAFSFTDAGNKYLHASSTPITAAPLSMSAWIYPTSSSNDNNIMQIQDASVGDSYFRFGLGDASEIRGARSDPTLGYSEALTSTTVTDNVWQHAFWIVSSTSNTDVYLNAAGGGNDSFSRTPTGLDSVSISREGDSTPGDEFDGNLAECAIWDVALATWEYQWLAAGGSPLTLKHRLGNLLIYQPLVRQLNAYGIGPSFTAFNSPGVVAHPPIIMPPAQILQFPPIAVGGATGKSNPLSGPLGGPLAGGL